MPNNQIEKKIEAFTMYDFRGGWASDESKKIILKQINKKLIFKLQQTMAETTNEYIEIIIEWEKEVGGLYDKDGQSVNLTYLFGKLNNLK